VAFLSPSRTALILGDDGVQVFNVGSLSSRFVDFIPWNDGNFTATLTSHLVRSCKKKPVVVLNNMVEQHYRKERVPKVSIMDRAAVVNRRLAVAFPSYKVRAALKLDQSKNRANEKGASYLFAAIPASAWTIFMGQHHNGGLRQIVIRDGELALTRMTPIIDTDVEPELWAKEVAGELNATMSYLTRFGYKDVDGLNVVVIANDQTQQALEDVVHLDCNLQIMDAQYAAKLLNSNLGEQYDLRYADALHAAYCARKSKFILPMQSAAIDNMTKPRKIAAAVIIGLLALSAYFGYNAFSKWSSINGKQGELQITQERKTSVEQEYQAELDKKKAVGFDFLLVSNSVSLHKDLGAEQIQPLITLQEIGKSLGADLTLDRIDVNAVQEKKKMAGNERRSRGRNTNQAENFVTLTEAIMTISYDDSVEPDLGVRKTNELRDRIAQRLPNYDVRILKQVADLSYTGNFVGETGNVSIDDEQEDYIAEISVRGERELRSEKSDISKMTKDMDDLSKGLAQFEKEKEDFANVQNMGFFDEQDRAKTKNIIEAMQRDSRLLTARYSLSPARLVPEVRAKEAGYDLISTDIDFSLEAIEDADIYRFVYMLNYGFPGQLKINKDFIVGVCDYCWGVFILYLSEGTRAGSRRR